MRWRGRRRTFTTRWAASPPAPRPRAACYTYYNDGRKATETDALGHTTTYNYDAAGRLTSVVDAQSHTMSYAYDDAGNQVLVTDANGRRTQQQYDARRRLVKTTYDDTTTTQYTYDGPGNLTKVTDQAGNAVQYTYDAANQLKSVVQSNHPDPVHNTTAYTYDPNGNLANLTDANSHTTQNAFDLLSQLKQETMPAGQKQTRTYDAAGNLISLTDYNGKTTTYTYDGLNRLTAKTPDASLGDHAVGFTYTATGKRASMTDASGTTTYTYDNLDRLKTKATPQGTLTYIYDAAGNVASMTSSNANGVSVAYTYDNLNRLATVVDNRLPVGQNTTTYAYDPAINVATVTYPNGLVSSFTYDDLNRLKSLNAYQYQLGPTGNRTSAAEPNGRTLNWSYDGIYRLTNETISLDPHSKNGTVGYGSDPVGNRLTQTSTLPGISTGSFTYDPDDRLSTETYDNNGNTTATGARTFAYDFENRLKSINAGAVPILYDGDGNRIAKTVNGLTTRYLVDDLNPTGYAQVVEDVVNSAVQRTYTYGSQRISQNQIISSSWKPSFYGYDSDDGSVRQLTDITGVVTDTYDYDAWGNLLNVIGTTPNTYLYRGEQYDPDLSLYFLRARYFNPLTGRFMTRDTYAGRPTDPITRHKYLYANGDIVDNSDPSGMLAPTPQQTPPQTGGRSASEYAAALTIAALPFAAIFVDTVTPAAYDIQCIWQREGAWVAVAYTVSLGIYVPGAHADPKSCGVVQDKEPDRKQLGIMRVQLQYSQSGTTMYTICEQSRQNLDPPGVLKATMMQAVGSVASCAITEPNFPNTLSPWLASAITRIQGQIATSSMVCGSVKGIFGAETPYKKGEWRIDVDNIRGCNLRK